jgi:hypothetical protein
MMVAILLNFYIWMKVVQNLLQKTNPKVITVFKEKSSVNELKSTLPLSHYLRLGLFEMCFP